MCGILLIGKIESANIKLGFILLMFMSIRFYKHLSTFHIDSQFLGSMYSGYQDPFYGLGNMILNYDAILKNFNF